MSRALATLQRRIVACERCPRLRDHCRETARVRRAAYRDQTYWGKPVPGFGDPKARLLVLGLAPAAHGANRTGRIFTGDRSGDFLYAALHRAGFANQPTATHRGDGLRLDGVWITAAARCAPPGNKPTPEELANCRPFLDEEFARLKSLRAVLALGRIGHDACLRRLRDLGHPIVLNRFPFAHGAEHDLPDGLRLIDSFHPSQQNTFTGRLTPEGLDSVLWAARTAIGEP